MKKTYEMTVLRSATSARNREALCADLIMSGSTSYGTTVICGIHFDLSVTPDYQQLRTITQMSNCGMVFEQLAEIKANFKVIAKPIKEELTYDLVETMAPLAIGSNNSFIVIPGDDHSIKTEAEAYSLLDKLEQSGKL